MAFSVRPENVSFTNRYNNFEITPEEESTIYNNIRLLYQYIDDNTFGIHIYPNSVAISLILKRARRKCGRDSWKISRRQVKTMIRSYKEKKDNQICSCLKIPYLSAYIFDAIFEIVQELEPIHEMNDALRAFKNKRRRESFFNEQYIKQRDYVNNPDETDTILDHELLNDLEGMSSPLHKKF